MKTVWTCITFAALASSPAAGQAGHPSIDLKTRVNRTALYPGDRLEYVVRAEHDASIQFVQDHVRKDQLVLDPFEILELSTTAGDLPRGRKFFEVRLLLTTFDTGKNEATIPAFNLFYFRQGKQQKNDNTPAETLGVPPMKIALSSTLTAEDAAIRTSGPVLRVTPAEWILPGVAGLCGMLAVAGYLIAKLLAWARAGFWKRVKTERKARRSVRESLEEIRRAPVDSPEDVLSFYGKASEILRGLADERLGDSSGLTPRELEAALRAAGDRESRATALAGLVEQCDNVRYSADGPERGLGRRSEFLREFEALAGQR